MLWSSPAAPASARSGCASTSAPSLPFGVALDGEANVRLHRGGSIAAGDSTMRVIVVESREDVVIARAARRFATTRVGNP